MFCQAWSESKLFPKVISRRHLVDNELKTIVISFYYLFILWNFWYSAIIFLKYFTFDLLLVYLIFVYLKALLLYCFIIYLLYDVFDTECHYFLKVFYIWCLIYGIFDICISKSTKWVRTWDFGTPHFVEQWRHSRVCTNVLHKCAGSPEPLLLEYTK